MKQGTRIAIGADHAGFELKEVLLEDIDGIEVKDFGTNSSESADYPDFAHLVASAVEKGEADFGILLCGTANGVAITANKHQGVRAALCWKPEVAVPARSHNNANVLCIPARHVSVEEAKEIVKIFFSTEFEGGRHARRVDKISC
ncbi:ribose 5-phosphate isomerase B [Mucilaginibacter hurinus]|uniref:Ribose 5-phosphate isomerase B n=1 Tax=Mucilaginibacter hurinus TaxID=2201324 RepID=A0A367GU62_9SPHI|nr:ribose 5-phosphate isomerase B [Mucilaginibacter hurinus]RCH56728.1 ribose 5-phosphate isomerase B [Mucilaginibacter hurinus]